MTTKTITTYSAGGYSLAAAYSELDVTSAGGFGGGVYVGHVATVVNAGTIRSTTTIGAQIGVLFSVGGTVINQQGGYIGSHQDGVFSDAALSLTNYGVIHGDSIAVEANAGGTIVNGGYAAPAASITGGVVRLGASGGGGVIDNFGTITSFVFIVGGGSITNGALEDTTALINGGGGIYMAAGAGTIGNFATILAHGSGANGVNLGAGGLVTNGAASDTAALIEGFTGVLMAAGTVNNFGQIRATGVVNGAYGVVMGVSAGDVVINGSGLDANARIEGYTAIKLTGPQGFVTNFGTIAGLGAAAGRYGVYLGGGGTVTNGGGADHTALIQGGAGVATKDGAATVRNFGTIFAGAADGTGVYMSAGALTNGSLNNATALIEGSYTGVALVGSAVSSNFGTIVGAGDTGGFGADLGGTESLVNGASSRQGALIEGYFGVYATGTANTLTNFGTIEGAGGVAVGFQSATDLLAVEAGCAFIGQVLGGGGTLELANGVGTLSGLFSSGGVTVAGSMAATTFQDFATVEVAAGAAFTTAGAVTLAAGQTLVSQGSLTVGSSKITVANAGVIETSGSGALTVAGAVKNDGTLVTAGGALTVAGAISGKGAAVINAGTLDLAGAFQQNVTFGGTTGVLELAQSQGYGGSISGFSKTGKTSLDLADIGFVSAAEASFSGTKTGGTLTVTDGTHTAHIALKGNYLSSTFVASGDGHGGTLVVDPRPPQVTPAGINRLVTAMSALAPRDVAEVHASSDRGHHVLPELAVCRTCAA